ncbi:MAG TPA: ABC transporter C-terminal domain-containing protein [Thermoanaerobaculia bacterium]|nr:ABC transporter C-terminal domain-containing protein [Thermoanaerobaculia bacterium]
MIRRIAVTLITILFACAAMAQEAAPSPVDLEKRLKALEEKVAQIEKAAPAVDLTEIQREIGILAKEIEALKTERSQKPAEADTQQFGLGAAASKVYRSEPGVSFGGYGEMAYQKFDSRKHSGAPAEMTDSADLVRGVLYTGFKFNKNVLFNSELEVEHASTESGGNVSLEFAYLDFLSRPELNARAGVVLLPIGMINEQHEPTTYFGVSRPVVETRIIPATWGEIGAGIFGDTGKFSYRGYLVTGLDSQKFEPKEGIREGRQAGAEAKADDLALTGRLDFHPFEGTVFGGSIYSGNSAQGRRTPSGARFGGRVTLGELHADSKFRGVSLRALWSRGTIGDAARINEANGLTGDKSIGKTFGGWYVESGYDLASVWRRGDLSVTPYARYERFDTQRSVPAGYERDPENDGRIWTLGVAVKPIPQTVIKVDYQNVNNAAGTGVNQFNIGLGYIF